MFFFVFKRKLQLGHLPSNEFTNLELIHKHFYNIMGNPPQLFSPLQSVERINVSKSLVVRYSSLDRRVMFLGSQGRNSAILSELS